MQKKVELCDSNLLKQNELKEGTNLNIDIGGGKMNMNIVYTCRKCN